MATFAQMERRKIGRYVVAGGRVLTSLNERGESQGR